MSKKHALVAFLAMVLTAIAALSNAATPAASASVPSAQQQVSDDCLKGQGTALTGYRVERNFRFAGRGWLLDFQEYDSGKTVSYYGVYRGDAPKKQGGSKTKLDDTPGYYFTPLVCNDVEELLVRAIADKYPGYTVKRYNSK